MVLAGGRNTFSGYLSSFVSTGGQATISDELTVGEDTIPRFVNEFWTSRQRQASPLHEISYRACFKPQLPRFFIDLLTEKGDVVYDPFSGRGTTVLEAGLMGRDVVANDSNPLSRIITEPRFFPPDPATVAERLKTIPREAAKAGIDLSMFYHPDTEKEIVALREYLLNRRSASRDDMIDRWIAMVATNRLTGHSSGFFSVYTLPPNQAVSQLSQQRINMKKVQTPEYRDTHAIILKKTRGLLKDLKPEDKKNLIRAGKGARLLTGDARSTPGIADGIVQLTVTSPPFLDIVQYTDDNWLRCWFNGLDGGAIGKGITMSRTLADWAGVMADVFFELFRITRSGGFVAFEVGEIRKKSIRLDEHVVPIGIRAGFLCEGVIINKDKLILKSKSEDRIILFQKP